MLRILADTAVMSEFLKIGSILLASNEVTSLVYFAVQC
jgi:hypothetical protein